MWNRSIIILTLVIICLTKTISLYADANKVKMKDSKYEESVSFNYLEFKKNTLLSTHAIKFTLPIPPGFTRIKPLNHQAIFNDHPFDISVAGLIKGDQIIIVHAETVSDKSGFLDYSYLKPTVLDGQNFYTKEQCLALPKQAFEEAKDLRHFKNNGFNFLPAIYLKQFFKNTKDGNSEYIISYGERVSGCSENIISKAFIESFNKTIERLIKLNKAL